MIGAGPKFSSIAHHVLLDSMYCHNLTLNGIQKRVQVANHLTAFTN